MVYHNSIKRTTSVLLSSLVLLSSFPMYAVTAIAVDDTSVVQTQNTEKKKFNKYVRVGYASFKTDASICSGIYSNNKKKIFNNSGDGSVYATVLKNENLLWKVNTQETIDNGERLYYYFLIKNENGNAPDNIELTLSKKKNKDPKSFKLSKLGPAYTVDSKSNEIISEDAVSDLVLYCYSENKSDDGEKFYDIIKNSQNASFKVSDDEIKIDNIGFSNWKGKNRCFVINKKDENYSFDFNPTAKSVYMPVEMSDKDKAEGVGVEFEINSDSTSGLPSVKSKRKTSNLIFKAYSNSKDGCCTGDTLSLSLANKDNLSFLDKDANINYYLIGDDGSKTKIENQFYVKDEKPFKLRFEVPSENSSDVISGEISIDSVINGMPDVSDCTVKQVDDANDLNVLPFGIYSAKSIQVTVRVVDSGEKSFDKILINGIKAKKISDDIYGVTMNEGSSFKNINVVFESNGKEIVKKVMDVINGINMNKDSDYDVLVSSDKPLIESLKGTSEYHTVTDEFDAGSSGSFNIPLRISSNSGIADLSISIYKEGTDEELTVIKSDGKKVSYTKKIDNVLLKNTSDKIKYSSEAVHEDTYALKINGETNKEFIEDGVYYADISVNNNSKVSSAGRIKFVVDRTKPDIQMSFRNDSDKEPVNIYYGNNNYIVYDNSATLVFTSDEPVEVTDYTLYKNKVLETEKAAFDWTVNEDGKYVAEWNFSDAGLYALKNFTVKDKAGNEYSFGKTIYRFGVDKEEAKTEIHYNKNVVSELSQLLSFGFYQNNEINVVIDITDDIAGVSKEDIKVFNKTSSGETDITKMFSVSYDGSGRKYQLKGTLKKDVAYQIKVSATDRLKRTENNKSGADDFEVAYTSDTPDISITNRPPEWINGDSQVEFTAVSDKKGQKSDSGLRNVKTVVYYRENINDEFNAVASITDDGKEIVSNIPGNGAFKLVRNTVLDGPFSNVKTTACSYALKIDGGKINSGYYKVDIYVENNVHSKDSESKYNHADSSIEFGSVLEDSTFGYTVSGDEGTNTCTVKGYTVYDGKAEFNVEISDITFEKMTANKVNEYLNDNEKFVYLFTDNSGNTISKYRFNEWKPADKSGRKYTSKLIIEDEGFYVFKPVSIENCSGKVTDIKYNKKNFAVDRNEAIAHINYSENVTDGLLEMLTFGLYRNNQISVTINVTDDIAGIQKSSIKIINTADGEDEDITSDFNFVMNDQKNGYIASMKFKKDKAYNIKVIANDKLVRNEPKNTEEKKPVMPDNPDYEISYTSDKPYVVIEDSAEYWFNSDKTINISAFADKNGSDVNSGLRSVKADIYYKPSKKSNEWVSVATVEDDGSGKIKNVNGFKLKRESNINDKFSKKKVESCNYTLTTDHKNGNEKVVSGYYKVEVTVQNNVLAKNSEDLYMNSKASTEFALSFEDSEFSYDVSGNDGTNTCKVQDSVVYDGKAEFNVYIKDITFETMNGADVNEYLNSPEKFDYSFVDSNGNIVSDYRFREWKLVDGKNDTYTAKLVIEDEGFYKFVPVSFENLSGTVTDLSKNENKFAVDRTEAAAYIKYSDKVTENLLEILTFGLYRNNDIYVTVNVTDDVAGVEKDSIKIFNTAGGADEDITYMFNFVKNQENNGYSATIGMIKDKAYNIKVIANDCLKREETLNTTEESPVIPSPDYEIAYTADVPAITLKEIAEYWNDGDLTLDISAAADKGSKGLNAGLRSVKVNIYYKESADASNWNLKASVYDNGKTIKNVSGFTLKRVNNIDSDFSKTKAESCDYTLTVSRKNGEVLNEDVVSGYYRVEVIAENNVLSKNSDNNYNSSKEYSEFGLDFEAPEVSIRYDNDNVVRVSDNKDYYSQARSLEVIIKDVSFNLEDIQNRSSFGEYSITDEHGNDISLSWEADPNESNSFIGRYKFIDSEDDKYDGAYTVNIPAFKDKVGKISQYAQTKAEFKGIKNDFVIDTTAPVIKYHYDNNNAEIVDQKYYYNMSRNLYVEIDEHNISIDDIKNNDFFKYSILDEYKQVYSITDWKQDEDDPNKYIGSYTFVDKSDDANDGYYTVSIDSFKDRSDNTALDNEGSDFVPYAESFIIDSTAPVISYSYDNNKKIVDGGVAYYDKQRTITVKIVEHNMSVNDLENLDYFNYIILDEHNEENTLSWSRDANDNNVFIGKYTFIDDKGDDSDGEYSIEIASLKDKAGNSAKNTDNFLFEGYTDQFVIDTTAPVITYSYDNNSKEIDNGNAYYNKQRTITVKVVEHNFTLEDVKNSKYLEYSIINEHNRSQNLRWEEKGQNTFVGTYTFVDDINDPDDGAYSVSISKFKDKAKQYAVNDQKTVFEGYTDKFVIDTTAPIISYSYDNNNVNTVKNMAYYSKSRKLTISIIDHSFKNDIELEKKFKYTIKDEHNKEYKLVWTRSLKNSNLYTTSFEFKDNYEDANDGLYNVILNEFHDKAKNNAVENGYRFTGINNTFIIDTTKPVVSTEYIDVKTLNKNHMGVDYYKADSMKVVIKIVDHNFDYTYKYNMVYQYIDSIGNKTNKVISQGNSRDISWRSEGNNTYIAEIRLEGNRNYEFVGYSVTDNANNNTSDEKNKQNFVIDNTAPNNLKIVYKTDPITKLIEVLTFGCYRADGVNISVSANDNLAGINKLTYECVGMNGSRSIGPVTVDYSKYSPAKYREETIYVGPQFKGYIVVTAEDFCGNSATYSTKTIGEGVLVDSNPPTIDFIAPVVKLNPEQKPKNGIFASDVTINVEVTDPLTDGVTSGIDRIDYEIINGTTGVSDKGTILNDKKTSNIFKTKFDVDSRKFNSNDVKINVYAYDNSSNEGKANSNIKIDVTKPTVSISYNGPEPNTVDGTNYYNKNRTAIITVTERNFDTADFKYKIDNTDRAIPILSSWTDNINPSDPDKTTHTARIEYTEDGDYTFDFSFEDLAGNKADTVPTQKFTIDKTNPVIDISFDNNSSLKGNNYYNKNRTANIMIKEHNFIASETVVNIDATKDDNVTPTASPEVSKWTSVGNDVYEATVVFADDGLYNITVNCKDMAANMAVTYNTGDFYIDKKVPELKITGVSQSKAYNDSVNFEILIDDINYAADYSYQIQKIDVLSNKVDIGSKLGIEVSDDGKRIACQTIPKDRNNDGIYILTASARDNAGNEKEETVKFSVNRYGSTYELDDETKKIAGQCISQEKDVVIREINVDPIEIEEVSVVLGNDTRVLEENKDFSFVKTEEPDKWCTAVYTIKSSVFSQEGAYTVQISSKDSKLNLTNKNTDSDKLSDEDDKPKLMVSFVVDKSSPLITLSGIEDGFLYEEESRIVTIVCEDFNLQNDTLKVNVGGKEYTYNSDDIIKTDSGIKLNINLTSSEYPDYIDVEVSVVDKAGNIASSSKTHFKLSTSWLERFFANKTLVIIIFGGFAILIGAIILAIIMKRKNKKSE